ncbi:MAG: cytochrome-c peroxidase [Paracoccaceae bacterium]
MAGQPGGTDAEPSRPAALHGSDGAWAMLAGRVAADPRVPPAFAWLNGHDDPLHITDIGRVIGDFIAFEFRSVDSPFDAFLRGDDSALSNDQRRGMSLFYGKAGCATCHSGLYQTDHGFHALGLPHLGPGKGHGPGGYADHGRAGVTGRQEDLYSFRTPSLRTVTITAPGHNGARPS